MDPAHPVSSTQPIGVFDSGVGGLTVLAALRRRLPQESMIYLGDTARVPYGPKSPETVAAYTAEAVAYLAAQGIKLLVVACNTATVHALPTLERLYPALPILGVVEPGAAAAVAGSRSGRIAVIATEGTVRSGAYEAAIHRLRPEAAVQARACGLLVALAEEGWAEDVLAEAVLRRYLGPMFERDPRAAPDCLVLGCTHFPLFTPAIRTMFGPWVTLVDSSETVAAAAADLLAERHLARADGAAPSIRYLATDGPDRFARIASRFLGERIEPAAVEWVTLPALPTGT
ncbi:glutamate racemase [Aliidongia dinghuensis]|uniref:Glutamate racemase n=1 Tax=Aliidongia dinghuensis TaxID=1867774 RepID=A0A8J3E3U1_9PROT|nr:glutamate racemase [Aliidongia dinghuensis]GGF18756.1 glutamate racemase [Aliidongia dinghuensis]